VSASQMIWSWNQAIRDLWAEADVLTGRSSLPDHRRIQRAIAAHNGAAAERAMRAHFADFIETVKKHFADAAVISPGVRS